LALASPLLPCLCPAATALLLPPPRPLRRPSLLQYTPVEVAYPGGSAAFAIRPKGKGKTVDKKSRW
jgi:hypothetical protein